MRKNNINLRILFFMLLSIVMIKTNAQTGLNFQGVARTSNNVILASQAITIKLSILQGSATGTADYTETRRVTTNAQGLFTAVIGDTGAISTLGNFTTINWKLTPKFLKIEMDAAAGTNFITMGTTQFQYVAYAQFAKSVDAENIVGIVPVTLGGTGVSTIAGLKTALVLNNVNNTTDLTKPISTLTQTALDLKLNATDTSKYTKQTYSDSALLTKLKLSDTASMLSNRIGKDTLNLSARINLKANMSDLTTGLALKLNATDTSKYTKQTYADSALLTKLKLSDTASMLSNRIGKDTLNLSARINLKANSSDMTSGLLLKENALNKSTATDLGGTTPSDILFPTQKAVKDYVTANNSGGGVADGGITTIKLSDGAVTDAKINTVSGSKVIGNITGNAATATLATTATTAGNITATTNTTLTSLSNLATVGTITSGVWSGTAVAVEKGGTGLTAAGTSGQVLTSTGSGTLTWTTPSTTATKLATARKINNVDFDGSADIIVSADAGTLTGTTIKSTVTGSSLTSVGTLTSATVNGKVIVGASTSASTSAVLEVNSTNQGFLPPRVYAAQRDAIVSPVAGLTIWCINCGEYGELNVYNGVAWVNMFGSSTSSVPSISIGQNYYGGKIAYILVSGDPGYDANTPHGLVAATVDQSTGIRWYNGTYTTTGATGTAIGTGLANTNTIITSQGATATSYAAGLARAYAGGGYTDWYLPSKDELNKLYLNRIAIGGFASNYYWSSTEAGSFNAWDQNFGSGFQNSSFKVDTDYVRAIRAF
jgi:hypothetical protein